MSHAQFRAHEICFETLPDEELLKLFAEHREKQRQAGFRFNDRVAGVGSKQSEMGIYVVDFCRNIYIYDLGCYDSSDIWAYHGLPGMGHGPQKSPREWPWVMINHRICFLVSYKPHAIRPMKKWSKTLNSKKWVAVGQWIQNAWETLILKLFVSQKTNHG